MIWHHKQPLRVSSHSPRLVVLIISLITVGCKLQQHWTNIFKVYSWRDLKYNTNLSLHLLSFFRSCWLSSSKLLHNLRAQNNILLSIIFHSLFHMKSSFNTLIFRSSMLLFSSLLDDLRTHVYILRQFQQVPKFSPGSNLFYCMWFLRQAGPDQL